MGLEIGAAIELGIGAVDEMNKGIKALKPVKPVYKPVAGSAVASGTGPTLVVCNDRPAAGRVWNILSAGVYGSDPHTPLGVPQAGTAGGFDAQGSASAPAAGGTVCSMSLPPGVYNLYYQTLDSGTLAAADNNNMRIQNVTAGTTIASPIIVDATTANNPASGGPIQIQLTAQSTIAVQAIAAASAGSVYTANLSAVPVTGSFTSNVFADFYSGELPLGNTIAGSFTDLFDSGQAVPVTKDYSKGVFWSSANDNIYSLVYNVLAAQQVVLVVNVAEYPVDSVEAMELA